MTKSRSRTYAESRALNLERQRWYDAFRTLREGGTIEEFAFTVDGHDFVTASPAAGLLVEELRGVQRL